MTTTIGGSNPTVVFPDGSTQNTAAVSATVTSISGQNNTATSYLGIPQGTTAERPSSPPTGVIRWNTTIPQYEIYDGTLWKAVTIITPPYSATYLIIAGGGGASWGGGGGGGFLTGSQALTVGTVYTFTVGSGGAVGAGASSSGSARP